MNSNRRVPVWAFIAAGIAAVVAVVLIVSAVLGNGKPDSNYSANSANASATQNNSSNSDATSNQDASDETTATATPASKIPGTVEDNMKISDTKDIADIDGFSKESVKDALNFVVDYSNMTKDNTYFVNGTFSQRDHNSLDTVKDALSPYFSSDLLSSELKKMNGKDGDALAKVLANHIFYFADNGLIKPDPDFCKIDSTDSSAAPKKGETATDPNVECISYYNLSDISYNSVQKDDQWYLDTTFTTTTVIPVVEDSSGTKGFVVAKYDTTLRLTENTNDQGKSEWEIVDYNNKVNVKSDTGDAPTTDKEVEKVMG